MKLIKYLGVEESRKWLRHFAIYECHRCLTHFKADVNDVKRGRKKNCGCVSELKDLPTQLNGVDIITDLGVVDGRRRALFQCSLCDNQFNADVSAMRLGKAKKHCGCYVKPKKEIVCVKKPNKLNQLERISIDLNMAKNKVLLLEYTWRNMIARCERKSHPKYVHYGARGISVCDEWRHSLYNFVKDMGDKPSDEYSIDRINNDGNYEASNCRWATQLTQQNNKLSTT